MTEHEPFLRIIGTCSLQENGQVRLVRSTIEKALVLIFAMTKGHLWASSDLQRSIEPLSYLFESNDASNFRKRVENLCKGELAVVERVTQDRNVFYRLHLQIVDCDFWHIPPADLDSMFSESLCGLTNTDPLLKDFTKRLMSVYLTQLKKDAASLAPANPVVQASFDHASAWKKYREYFEREMAKPAFGMDLIGSTASIADLFVPLRACDVRDIPGFRFRSDSDVIDPSVLLRHHKSAFDTLFGIRDGLTVIQGNPGSGKSSLLRIFTLEKLRADKKAIFVPLQKLVFTAKDLNRQALEQAIKEYVKKEAQIEEVESLFDTINPLPDGVIFVLDSLDELQLIEGKSHASLLIDAATELCRVRKSTLIVSTRHETAADVSDRITLAQAYRYELLRYYYAEEPGCEYEDVEELRNQHDYRNDWWMKIGDLVGRKFSGLPEELSGLDFAELTSEPLNNLMTAISYLNPTETKKLKNTGQLYENIMGLVRDRGFEPYRRSKSSKNEELLLLYFESLLQDIALASWPNGGRLALMSTIKVVCEASGHQEGFQKYIGEGKYDGSNILVQFYFRDPHEGPRLDERRVEFSHKSFADWLLTRKILSIFRIWVNEKKPNEPNFQNMIHWMGVSRLTTAHAKHIQNEFTNWNDKALKGITELLFPVFKNFTSWGFDIVSQAPGTVLSPNRDGLWTPQIHFGFINTTLKNLWMISDIAIAIFNQRGDDKLKSPASKPLFELLQSPNERDPAGAHFRNVEIDSENLDGMSLNHLLLDGNFKSVSFAGSNLAHTVLDESRLTSSNFSDCSLHDASFQGSSFYGCSFRGAFGSRTNFQVCDFTDCDFSYSELAGPQFAGCTFFNCNFEYADLTNAEIEDASFDSECRFEGARASVVELNTPINLAGGSGSTTLAVLGWKLAEGKLVPKMRG